MIGIEQAVLELRLQGIVDSIDVDARCQVARIQKCSEPRTRPVPRNQQLPAPQSIRTTAEAVSDIAHSRLVGCTASLASTGSRAIILSPVTAHRRRRCRPEPYSCSCSRRTRS